MTIIYGDAELPDIIYRRAIEYCLQDKDGHWIWRGAHSGKRNHPQIGCKAIINGVSKIKVVSVAKLIYTVKFNSFPYQLRRDRALCDKPLCCNPDHFYVIHEKPKPRKDGKRNRNLKRVPVISLEEEAMR